MSGDLEGCYYTISGNDADSLELDLQEGSLKGYGFEIKRYKSCLTGP